MREGLGISLAGLTTERNEMPLITFFFTFLLSFSLCYYLTPLVRKAAYKFGIVDKPDGKLKTQKKPVAYLGGLAIYLSFLIALALVFEFSRETLGILLGGTIVIILGLVDDFGVLEPKIKILGQILAAVVLVRAGIYIKLAFLPVYVSIPLSVLWLVAITNAFNIIDIMDGLSSGIGFISAVVLFVIALMNGRMAIAALTIALAGSLLGFLRYNFQPATIYMGDTGSLFIGLMIGTLAMIGTYTENNMIACLVPVVILGLPIFDTLFVMYIRKLRGIPVFFGSSDHFALRLRRWKLSIRQTVVLSYLICLVLGGVGIGMMLVNSNLAASFIILSLVTGALLAGLFLKKIDMTL